MTSQAAVPEAVQEEPDRQEARPPARRWWRSRRAVLVLAGALVIILGSIYAVNALAGGQPRHEQVVPWDSYEVTSANTITFTVVTGDKDCFYLRHVAHEEAGTLSVAFITGRPEGAPLECKAIAVYQTIEVTTQAPAKEVTITQIPEDELDLVP